MKLQGAGHTVPQLESKNQQSEQQKLCTIYTVTGPAHWVRARRDKGHPHAVYTPQGSF